MSVNIVVAIGNATKDAELRLTPSGKAVANFSIACNEKFGDRESVEYLNVVAWNKLAEICGKYVTKGKQVFIMGRMQTRSYDDRDGNKRYVTEIVADKMQLLGGRSQAPDDTAQNENAPSPYEDDAPW